LTVAEVSVCAKGDSPEIADALAATHPPPPLDLVSGPPIIAPVSP
jgi:hypothetical protein